MKRVLRWTWNVLAALSLLLCAAACLLWVRSYSGSAHVSRHQALGVSAPDVRSRVHTVRWTRGRIHVADSLINYYTHDAPYTTLPPADPLPPPAWGVARLGRA